MKTKDFVDKWDNLRQQKGLTQRIDPTHPLDFFIRINEKGYDQLVLITYEEPSQLRSSKALEVEKNRRKDGRWATQISSIDRKNQEIFARLCVDLVDSSSSCTSEKSGLSRVTSRFLSWQNLFAHINENLSKQVLKGLCGEISFLESLVGHGVSKDDAIASWVGPEGYDRDFVLNDTWYEVKAISTGKDKVTISSLNQLETQDDGFLVVKNIDETTRTDQKAVSVTEMINNIRGIFFDAPNASKLLETKLVSVGYIDKAAYDEIFFVIGETSCYRVDKAFPRLVTGSVPPAIVGARYDLSLAGLNTWRIEETSLWNCQNTGKTI